MLATLAVPTLTVSSIVFVMFIADPCTLLPFTGFRLGGKSTCNDFNDNEYDIDAAVRSDNTRNENSLVQTLTDSEIESESDQSDDVLIVSKIHTEY